MDDSPGGREEKSAREDPESEDIGSNAKGCCCKTSCHEDCVLHE